MLLLRQCSWSLRRSFFAQPIGLKVQPNGWLRCGWTSHSTLPPDWLQKHLLQVAAKADPTFHEEEEEEAAETGNQNRVPASNQSRASLARLDIPSSKKVRDEHLLAAAIECRAHIAAKHGQEGTNGCTAMN